MKPRELSLNELASNIPLRKQFLSEKVAEEILKLFRISIWSTVLLTLALAGIDACFLASGVIKASERLITDKVIMTIIGASLVQVGAASTAIVYALFAKPPATQGGDEEA